MVSTRASCVVWMVCVLAACSFDDQRSDTCKTSENCEPGENCLSGFCVREEGSGSGDSAGASGTRGSAGRTGMMSNPNTEAGSSGAGRGAAGTRGSAGRGGSGGRTGSSSGGTGGMIPPRAGSPASGGAGSDECDDGEDRACLVDPDSTTASEVCNRGTQRCVGGTWAICVGEPAPETEQCNGLDDDCDDAVDEDSDQVCYSDGQTGCREEEGRWTCTGTCAVGKQTCVQGELGQCTGAKMPGAESCTAAGAAAADENCDGVIDETCACSSGETRSCYSGGADTINVGKCIAGTQTCNNGALGACMNEITPATETCSNPNVDDDCNGTRDDVASLGGPCVIPANSGICRAGTLQCQTGAEPTCVAVKPIPEACNGIDDDCNGRVDDTFNLQTDAKNCGACGRACAAGESCCAGSCANPQTDASNCGMCGMACPSGSRCEAGKCATTMMPPDSGMPDPGNDAGMPMPGGCQPACAAGQTCCGTTCVTTASDAMNCGACGTVCTAGMLPGCCAGRCVDLLTRSNCGECGRDCSLLGTGVNTCECVRGSDGAISCMGPVLNVCL